MKTTHRAEKVLPQINARRTAPGADITSMLTAERMDIAPLEVIDFARLATKEPSEVDKLLRLCQIHGFFYLDLQTNDAGRQILADEKRLLEVMEQYFHKPMNAKMKDNVNSFLHGYKPAGTFSGITENSRDCYETYKVSHETLTVARAAMVDTSATVSEIITKNVELFDSYISLSQHITQTMLSCLSDALHLDGPTRLEHSHRAGEPTNTTLVLLSYPPETDEQHIGHNKHTDIGSLTLLFSHQWGLQVIMPEAKGAWSFVKPRPGHAVINVGDSLRFLSGKYLMSCLHRVVPVNPEEHRYSIAYFLRPESKVEFRDPEERTVTAEEWHDRKYVMFAEPHEVQAKSRMLMGGMEQLLVN